jgi:signal transduction histidine kinase
MYGTIGAGLGLFVTETWFSSTNKLLTESIATIIVAALTLPLLLFLLKRLCHNAHMKQAVIFWRFIWLLPIFFFAITILSSSYFTDSNRGLSFIIIRIIMYCALILICFLLENAIRQISEAEELSRKTDFYRRMAHDLLTPLTKVSTCVQTAQRRPEEADDLLAASQNEIMKMADMVNEALK